MAKSYLLLIAIAALLINTAEQCSDDEEEYYSDDDDEYYDDDDYEDEEYEEDEEEDTDNSDDDSPSPKSLESNCQSTETPEPECSTSQPECEEDYPSSPNPNPDDTRSLCLFDLLDGNQFFNYETISNKILNDKQKDRDDRGLPRLLAFNWDMETCEDMNMRDGVFGWLKDICM